MPGFVDGNFWESLDISSACAFSSDHHWPCTVVGAACHAMCRKQQSSFNVELK